MIMIPAEQTVWTDLAEQMAAEMSEEQLLREIGLRVRTFAMYPAAAASIAKSIPQAAALERAWDDLSEFGGWIFRRLHRQLQAALPDGSFDAEYEGNGLAGSNGARAIVSVLTATVGVTPAVASVVAALVLKRLLKPGWEETYARQPQLAAVAH